MLSAREFLEDQSGIVGDLLPTHLDSDVTICHSKKFGTFNQRLANVHPKLLDWTTSTNDGM